MAKKKINQGFPCGKFISLFFLTIKTPLESFLPMSYKFLSQNEYTHMRNLK